MHRKKLRNFVARGAKGVKLFAGHGASHGHGPFHTMPLDDPRLTAVYEIIKEHNLPVLFHVNYAKYKDEFERVLTAHPTMKVLCPHFCLTLRDTRKVDSLLSRYPNLWMDVSFGWIQFQAEGYRRIDVKLKVRAVINAHPNRFLYGTDLVLTDYENKDEEWDYDEYVFLSRCIGAKKKLKPARSMELKWGPWQVSIFQTLC